MNGTFYMILAYTAGLGLFLTYAAALWQTGRSLDRTDRAAARNTENPNRFNRGGGQ